MGIEIEHKFLVKDDRWRRSVASSSRIAQGYLGGSRASVRVRIEDDHANVNIKSRKMGTTRQEYEYPIPLADVQMMMETLTEPGVIDKTRHRVPVDNVVFEIDEFHGDNAGLIVAEVELQSADQTFPRPEWLGEEVTDQERYYNVALARKPYRSW